MANNVLDLVTLPLEDNFKTTLAQSWNWATWTVYVADTPNFTFPSWVTTYIVADPWKSNMQIAEINAYDSSAKTITVNNITLNKWASISSSASTHSVWAEIIISDNYQFWADIRTAINSKVAQSTWQVTAYANATARDAAITSPANWMQVYLTSEWYFSDYVWWAWSTWRWTTSVWNADTTTAWKVEIATQTEVDTPTDTWWSWATNVVIPSTFQQWITNKIATQNEAETWTNDTQIMTPLKTKNAIDYNRIFWGDWTDWAISWALTITWSNDTYIVKNYTTFTPWANTVTITPTNCILHIKVKGDCDLTGTTFNFQWKWAAWWAWWATTWAAWVVWSSWNTTIKALFSSAFSPAWWSWASASSWWPWAWWTITNIINLSYMQAMRILTSTCWGWGWWGWAWNTAVAWWTGWAWGWAVILEVAWDLTFSWTTIDLDWADWSNWGSDGNSWGWGWGWGWGWVFICLYSWTLTWSNTPSVAWWTGWTWGTWIWWYTGWDGWGGWASAWADWTIWSNNSSWTGWNGWAWATWLYLIAKNQVF